MADPYKGGMALGEMLFGRADPKAGLAEAGQVYRNASALEQARIDRAQRMARDALPDAIDAQAMLDPAQRQLLKSTLGMAAGQPNLNTAVTGLGELLDLETRGFRSAALNEGDVVNYNKLTQLQAGKEYQPIVQEGGVLRPSGIAIGDEAFTMVPTPQAAEQIAATQARVSQGQQRTDAAVDKTRRAPQGGKRAKSDDIIEQARERIAAGRSAKEVADHLFKMGYPLEAKKIYSGK